MRTILFFVIALFFANNAITYSWTYRTTKDGGEKGYNFTKYKRSGGENDDKNTIIKASGNGTDSAPTKTNKSEQRAMDYALAQISKGVLKGIWKDKKNKKTVTWQSNDKTGRTSTIEIIGIREVIPKEVKE